MTNVLKRNNVKVLGDEGPVLVYAHGFGCNQDMWSLIAPAFRAMHRQVLFDYVGSGDSDRGAFDRLRYADLRGYALDVLEPVQDLLSSRAKNARWMNCKLVFSNLSQFFHNRLFFSNQAKLRSTTQRWGITLNVCSSLRLAICTATCPPRMSWTPWANGRPT